MKKVLIAFVLSAICGMADPIGTGTITLTGVNGASVDGYYVSPYYAQLGSQNLTVYCVDFLDEISIGESWPVDIYSGTDLLDTPFPSTDYAALFWLAAQDTPSTYINTQLAMWTETDPGFSDATPASNALLSEAGAESGSVDLANWDVIIPTGGIGQVFIVDALTDTPEPAAWVTILLGIGMIGIGKIRHRRSSGI